MMDLALALWHINPAAEYTLTDDQSAIREWRSPNLQQPTEEELEAAWAGYLASEWPEKHGYAPSKAV